MLYDIATAVTVGCVCMCVKYDNMVYYDFRLGRRSLEVRVPLPKKFRTGTCIGTDRTNGVVRAREGRSGSVVSVGVVVDVGRVVQVTVFGFRVVHLVTGVSAAVVAVVVRLDAVVLGRLGLDGQRVVLLLLAGAVVQRVVHVPFGRLAVLLLKVPGRILGVRPAVVVVRRRLVVSAVAAVARLAAVRHLRAEPEAVRVLVAVHVVLVVALVALGRTGPHVTVHQRRLAGHLLRLGRHRVHHRYVRTADGRHVQPGGRRLGRATGQQRGGHRDQRRGHRPKAISR